MRISCGTTRTIFLFSLSLWHCRFALSFCVAVLLCRTRQSPSRGSSNHFLLSVVSSDKLRQQTKNISPSNGGRRLFNQNKCYVRADVLSPPRLCSYSLAEACKFNCRRLTRTNVVGRLISRLQCNWIPTVFLAPIRGVKANLRNQIEEGKLNDNNLRVAVVVVIIAPSRAEPSSAETPKIKGKFNWPLT